MSPNKKQIIHKYGSVNQKCEKRSAANRYDWVTYTSRRVKEEEKQQTNIARLPTCRRNFYVSALFSLKTNYIFLRRLLTLSWFELNFNCVIPFCTPLPRHAQLAIQKGVTHTEKENYSLKCTQAAENIHTEPQCGDGDTQHRRIRRRKKQKKTTLTPWYVH